MDVRVRVGEQSGIGCDKVAVAISGRKRRTEPFPLGRKERADAAGQPFDFDLPSHGHGGQHDLADPLRKALGVGQRESRAPRRPLHQPPVHLRYSRRVSMPATRWPVVLTDRSTAESLACGRLCPAPR